MKKADWEQSVAAIRQMVSDLEREVEDELAKRDKRIEELEAELVDEKEGD
uniref:Uncharacterized protein n=1 Tax=viral metagenome TaxID=1070528 RepID=A0A6H1ZBE9_9ZZZZ